MLRVHNSWSWHHRAGWVLGTSTQGGVGWGTERKYEIHVARRKDVGHSRELIDQGKERWAESDGANFRVTKHPQLSPSGTPQNCTDASHSGSLAYTGANHVHEESMFQWEGKWLLGMGQHWTLFRTGRACCFQGGSSSPCLCDHTCLCSRQPE